VVHAVSSTAEFDGELCGVRMLLELRNWSTQDTDGMENRKMQSVNHRL
jgi:hypothetical protein